MAMKWPLCQFLQVDNSKIKFRISKESFNPYHEFKLWENEKTKSANSLFIGKVRGVDQFGNNLKKLEIVHYPGMTEKYIERYLSGISKREEQLSILLLHRVGIIYPNEPIILIATCANHRGIANKYCHEILEYTKYKIPLWKKEWTFKGSSWVKENTKLRTDL